MANLVRGVITNRAKGKIHMAMLDPPSALVLLHSGVKHSRQVKDNAMLFGMDFKVKQ